MPEQTPLPGWYPHPADPALDLWWDGARWTDRSRPAATAADAPQSGIPQSGIPLYGTPSYGTPSTEPPAPYSYAAPAASSSPAPSASPYSSPAGSYAPAGAYTNPHAQGAVKNNWAIASLVLGIAGVVLSGVIVLPILAIVFAQRGAARAVELGVGAGLAKAGRVLGIVGVVLSAITIVARWSGVS